MKQAALGALVATVLTSLLLPSQALAVTPTENAVYGLAQQCYAVRSPGTGEYLQKSNGVFRFGTTNVNHAEKFFMKPARLGDFLMTDRAGKYLTSAVPSVETSVSTPSRASEWDISAREVGSNRFRFRFKNRLTQLPVQHEYIKKIKHTWWWYTWYTYEPRVEQHFDVVARSDCKPYPEIAPGVRGNRDYYLSRMKGDANTPVRGFVDAHAHITSYEFMGGKVMHGAPFHKYGVPYALNDSKYSHGPNGSLDLIGNLFEYGDPGFRYDTRGWPDFPFWPNARQKTHTGYYWTWLERAWLSGMRLHVSYLVENEVLCKAQSTINPIGWQPHNSCDTMDSIRLQAKRMRELEEYIDAQYGGPGKGFFRIVTSPRQAREVIADGKLAVIMGVEASETLNCGVRDFCSVSKIEQGLNELHNLGIRAIFPSHKFDNQFTGTMLSNGFINLGQALATGHYYNTEQCDAQTRGKHMESGLPVIGEVPVIQPLIYEVGGAPKYDDHGNHCNTEGLVPLGVYLVNRMIDLNMIIDMDHLSAKAAGQILDITEARDYSGVVSSHSFMHNAKDGGLHENFKRLLRAGGFAADYINGADGARNGYGAYLDVVKQTPYLNAVGLGTDTSGLAAQPGPRGSASHSPLPYPFTNEFGLTFDRPVAGNRTFDLNNEGMAHYGLLADLVQDTRNRGGEEVYNALMKSAEGYLQMWERAESNNTSAHFDSLSTASASSIVSGRLKQIDVGAEVWGVNSSDAIYKRNGNGWTRIPGRLKHVSVGPQGDVWGVNGGDYIYRYNEAENNWTRIGGRLKQIDVGGNGDVWGVNSSDAIYKRNGNSWTRIPGRLKHVSVGPHGDVWGVNSGDYIYRYNEAGNNWTRIDGRLKQIDVGPNGDVWGVNANNHVYQRGSNGWIRKEGTARHVSSGNSNSVWATLPDHRIKRLRQ